MHETSEIHLKLCSASCCRQQNGTEAPQREEHPCVALRLNGAARNHMRSCQMLQCSGRSAPIAWSRKSIPLRPGGSDYELGVCDTRCARWYACGRRFRGASGYCFAERFEAKCVPVAATPRHKAHHA